MANLFGRELAIEVRQNKKTGKYTVTILDHGERISCTDIDASGDNINEKVVQYISEQIGGNSTEGPQLTQQGEMSHRQAAVTFNPLEEDEEKEEEGYNPLNDSPIETDPYDVGNFGI
jgi:hypothetical protein